MNFSVLILFMVFGSFHSNSWHLDGKGFRSKLRLQLKLHPSHERLFCKKEKCSFDVKIKQTFPRDVILDPNELKRVFSPEVKFKLFAQMDLEAPAYACEDFEAEFILENTKTANYSLEIPLSFRYQKPNRLEHVVVIIDPPDFFFRQDKAAQWEPFFIDLPFLEKIVPSGNSNSDRIVPICTAICVVLGAIWMLFNLAHRPI